MTSLGIGVIGVGAMGRIHAENIATRVASARLAAIADVDLDAAREVGGRLGVERLYADYGELLSDADVAAVVISAPRHHHVPMTIDAAAAGKQIFCEKPLASTVAEADRALAAVATANVVLQIGFHRHFDADFRQVRDAIASGGIGEVQIVHMTARDPVTPGTRSGRSAEDLLLETTIHDLDMARRLTGSAIETIYTVGIPTEEPGLLDGAVLALRMTNGVVATIDNHLRSPYGYDQRVEVFGSGGMVAIANETRHTAKVSTETGVASALPLDFFAERYAAAYVAEMESFVGAVLGKTRPLVTGEDGRAAVAAAVAALASLRDGRPVGLGE